MVRPAHILAALLSLALALAAGSALPAQSKKGAEFVPGTVVSIEKEKTGRNYKMKIKASADDAEFDVQLKPTTQLAVIVKGDESFLRPNVMIMTSAVTGTANNFTAKDFTVFIGASPPPQLTPDPKAPTVYTLCGKVLAKEADGLLVQCGAQPRKVLYEGALTVSVKFSDASLIKEGDAVDVEGTLIKTKKQINATVVNVTSSEPINADEYFAALEERSGKKSKTAKSKTAKAKTEGAEGEVDPFGVLKGKKAAPKTKAEKAAEAEVKKAEAKSDDAKKTDAKDGAKPAADEKNASDKKE